jgi:hypothetical protein
MAPALGAEPFWSDIRGIFPKLRRIAGNAPKHAIKTGKMGKSREAGKMGKPAKRENPGKKEKPGETRKARRRGEKPGENERLKRGKLAGRPWEPLRGAGRLGGL